MHKQPAKLILISTVVLCCGGIAALSTYRSSGARVSLAQVRALARGQDFDQARALLLQYLRSHPQEVQAHLLMAQLATEPTAPQPELAIEHIAAVRPESSQRAAVLKFFEGKARYQQKRYDLAAICWNEALRLDPLVPEAGWALLDLLDLEGRVEEAHMLGMRLHASEPDPRDKVRALLETARLDIDQVAPGSQVQIFEPLVAAHPDSLVMALTLGLALVHDSKPGRGLLVLERAVTDNRESTEAWAAWLTGLQDGHEFDRLAREFARLPGSIANDPRFAKFEGMIAENAHDWPRAVSAYGRAHEHEPYNGPIAYRLRQALALCGLKADYDRLNQRYAAFQSAFKQLRAVLAEANSIKTLGLEPHMELYQRLAALREQMGRRDEACAWHRLALQDCPDNVLSLAALKRLQ
jgi:tetratricopeptide (TPR) repeat protein